MAIPKRSTSGHGPIPVKIREDMPNFESDGSPDTYVVVMQFAAAIKYSLVVEHRDSDDNLIKTVKDMDFESQAPEDQFSEGLRVVEV